MMLYVFHVDVGRMMSFDMTVALSSVENLKDTIQRLHGIPATNIVLLVSGGEMLTHCTQVSCYSAGTDTNPIYMFLTGDERAAPTIASGGSSSDADDELRRQVEESDMLPAVLETVRQRALLAVHMSELGRKEEKLCERLVHEQHLQQQGWSAVVANLEDLTVEFEERFRNFCQAFDRHLQQRESYLELLRNFRDDLSQLARIPILPALMALAQADFHGFDELLEQDPDALLQRQQTIAESVTEELVDADVNAADSVVKSTTSSTSPNKKLKMGHEQEELETEDEPSRQQHQLNLLQWISSKGNHEALQQMCDECEQGLNTFSVEKYDKLKQEVQNIIGEAKNSNVKEIKGLSERLCRLDEFKYKIGKMVQDQREQATALQQNEARALKIRDNSVLPDLCISHRTQLKDMLKNHIKIREYCRCIGNSKEELGLNLHKRLCRIVWIENSMSEFDNRLLFNHRCLRRAERHIGIIEQIHRAPSIYVAAVAEVVRRKIFSDQFRLWASRLSVDFDRIHGEELQRRQLFNANFDGHFLNILFPGMADMPPAFAQEHPELSFDTRLPQLSCADIELLSKQLPELAAQLQLPDMAPVLQFFVQQTEGQAQQQLPEVPFEYGINIGVGTSNESLYVEQVARSTATEQLLMMSAGTLTDEHAGSVDQLRQALQQLGKLALEGLRMARSDLSDMRHELTAGAGQDELQSELQLLQDKLQLMRMQCERREQAQEEHLEQLRQQLLAAEQDKAVAVAQAREQLIHEHKTELESLRCRFKLMTSMERSPSDSSLEKLERPTSSASVASLDVEQLLAQQRQDLNAQRERAVLEAVEAERALWQSRQPQFNSESVMANVSILKDMLEDKERQLDMLREQNRLLTQDTYQLKTRIDVLTNEDGNSWLKEKIDYLSRDKSRLEEELNMEKSKRLEMETSVAAMRSSVYEVGAPCTTVAIPGAPLTRSRSSGGSASANRYITLEGCAKGDLVFVVWSMRHAQFMVVQDSLTLYFVHADSLAALQLTPPQTLPPPAAIGGADAAAAVALPVAELHQIPLPYYAIGRVIDKEYCQARKDENRYRVSRGSKFYRIKLAPLPSRNLQRRERLECNRLKRC
ncbi:RB1-inducible coiled-coil protein 1 isoform X2 [Drosophila busckii]|uniref:RB1-inducible coiled-coil protein 1 isoform X2 n=1 Tax=Drosophila busckii TaxID=30019 RepID=UPI00083F36FF|nr:RB1-inducible coiled-coil protein 1 isoform X2 [Drosophila busckii]